MTSSPQFNFDNLYANNAAAPRALGESKKGKYDFAVAYPDPGSMPLDGLIEGLKAGLAEDGEDLAFYYYSPGYTPLRQFVADKLARDRNIHITADDVVLGDGSGQPIHMIIETLVNPGDVVLTDDFVYSGTLGQLRRFGADIRGVDCDGDGMIPDVLDQTIATATAEGKKPKFIYLIPTFQNPQGWTMSLERRKAVLAICQSHGVPILEDDCYIDLRYDGHDVTSFHSLDDNGLVMYVGSFSKVIAPGMRLGYMTAPRPVLERALAAKSGGAVNTFAAIAVHRFSIDNLYSHVEEINDIGREKRDAMLGALDKNFANTGSTWSNPEGGLFIWLTLPEGADVEAVRDRVLERADVGYQPGSGFAPDGTSGNNCLRLTYGYNTPEEIGEGIANLAEAFRHEGLIA